MDRFANRLFYALACFISLAAFLGSIAYLAVGLTMPLRITVFILSVIGSGLMLRYAPLALPENGSSARSAPSAWPKHEIAAAILYALAALAGLYLLLQGRSDRPLISPWETVSAWEFAAYGLASGCLLFLSRRRERLPLLSIIHYAWSFGVFLAVYSIGYGFDPFIHEASVKAIEANGRIQPLTPYYLGQYSLVSMLHAIFGGTIAWWSKLLVPALAAVLIPLAVRRSGLGLLLLAFSFSIFALTTPQNLAYLFLILIILVSLSWPQRDSRFLVWLLALAAVCTQPVAGIPALLMAASLTYGMLSEGKRRWNRYRKPFTILLAAGYALAVPCAFYFFGNNGADGIGLSWPQLGSLLSSLSPANPSSEHWLLNFTYLFSANRGWIYGLLAVLGTVIAYRRKESRLLRLYALPALALFISAIAAAAIDFHSLIEYEQNDYPLRLLVIAALFALPLAMLPLQDFLGRLKDIRFSASFPLYIVLSALLAASLYLSYPRFDNYHNSHGYAVSKADVLAAQWIEKDAQGRDYIVLANQQASAGALREYGFKKYYRNDIFYYPIPTGGPLYQHYLAMVEKPSRETMEKAMELAGVDLAYVSLDDYWWAADKIAAEAELVADHAATISNGQVRVYSFKK